MKDQSSECICILGMHRSGTSCLAGILENAGVANPVIYEFNQDNFKGNRENQELHNLNVELLKSNDAKWEEPKIIKNGPNDLLIKAEQVIKTLNIQSKYWLFKDPRTLLTLGVWNQLLPKTTFVASFRNPIHVALSLWSRDNFSIVKGLELWLYYNRILLDFSQKNRCYLVNFDQNKVDYHNAILNLGKNLPSDLNLEEGLKFYESNLINQKQFQHYPKVKSEVNSQLLAKVDLVFRGLLQQIGLELPKNESATFISLNEDKKELEEILLIQPDNYFVHQQIARSYFDNNEIVQAKKHLLKSIASNPKNLWNYEKLVKIYKNQNQSLKAIDLLVKAILLNPLALNLRFELANFYLNVGNLVKAEQVLKKAITQNNRNLSTHLRLFRFYSAQMQFEKAINVLKNIQHLNIHFDEMDLQLGICYLKKGQNVKALEYFVKGRKKTRNKFLQSRYFLQEGKVYNKSGNVKMAKKSYHSVTEDKKLKSLAMRRLAIIAKKEGNLDRALTFCNQSIDLNGSLFNCYLLRAQLYIRMNDKASAFRDINFSLSITPNTAKANYILGNLYFRLEDFLNARKCYLGALKFNPQNYNQIQGKIEKLNKILKKV